MQTTTNPLTLARQQGQEAARDPHKHLGLNPYVRGTHRKEWHYWVAGYEDESKLISGRMTGEQTNKTNGK